MPQFHSKMKSNLVLWFAISLSQCYANYWHIYDPERVRSKEKESCALYENSQKSLKEMVDSYQLWPNVSLSQAEVKKTSTIYGLEYALDYIWKHQHPKDCSSLKFVLNGVHNGGFGSELHVHGGALGVALTLDRVFVLNPVVHSAVRWEFDNQFCHSQQKGNFECYYLPLSSCTIHDVLGPNALNIIHQATKLSRNGPVSQELYVHAINHEEREGIMKNATFRQEFLERFDKYKVLYIRNPGWLNYAGLPPQFSPLLNCSPIPAHFHYYWWRAISMVYFMRPNLNVQEWIFQHRLSEFETVLLSTTHQFVSLYVRRGDKSIEMRLPEVSEFTHALTLLHKQNLVQTKVVFLASEDSRVINSLKEWNSFHQKYKLYWTEVFDRKGLLAERSAEERNRFSAGKKDHHPDEYLSMLLNIHYLIQGSAFICTLASNFCRIVDELRATVAGRADKIYVDLSAESCGRTPCINGNLTELFWR